jgi:hypothetical protein
MHHRRMAWTAFAFDATAYTFDAASLPAHWGRLHAGDAEPLPADPKVLAAWSLFHAGRFEDAPRRRSPPIPRSRTATT